LYRKPEVQKLRGHQTQFPASALMNYVWCPRNSMDLLTQGAKLEDVQYLAGHTEPRTTGLYDRRQKKVTRNIVERISI